MNNYQKPSPHYSNYSKPPYQNSHTYDNPTVPNLEIRNEKPLTLTEGKEEDNDAPIICHKCNGENHYARDCKAKFKSEKVKDQAYYLEKANKFEEKGKSYVAEVKRDVQIWSSGDEDESEKDNKRKRGKLCRSEERRVGKEC